MPLNTSDSILYNFNRSYDNMNQIIIPIRITSAYTGTSAQTLVCYTNRLDEIQVYPVFGTYNGQTITPYIDNYRYFIDLGDGTITTDLTATHYYKQPGNYQITIVAVDSATNFYVSVDRPTITAYNIIPDEIFTTYGGATTANGSMFTPIILKRYNSYQTWSSVSADGGYTIKLNVSGNVNDFISGDEYYSDSLAHFKQFAMFGVKNELTGEIEITENIKTTNTLIYGKRSELSSSNFILYSYPEPGAVFLGTSGTREFYYYED